MPDPIHKARTMPHDVADVYAAWVSPETVVPPATAMEIDPRIGGHYRLIIEGPDFEARCDGVFCVVDPRRRLVYTWQWRGNDEMTEIDVSFAAEARGTRVTILHSGFTSEKSRTNHDRGWDNYLDGFVSMLG